MKNLYSIIAPVLTGLMWIILILITSVTISLVTGDKVVIDVTTTISIIVMVLTTFIWTPRGTQLGEDNPRTKALTKLYNWRVKHIVNNQMFKELSDFCVIKNEQKRIEIIKEKLANKQIAYDDYLVYKAISEKKSKLTKEEQKQFLERFKRQNKKGVYVFDKRGKFLKKFIKKKIRFQKLKPKHIIHSHRSGNSLVPKNKEHIIRGLAMTVKVGWGVLLGVFAGALILQTKHLGIEEFTKIAVWTGSIVGNVFTSIRTGIFSVINYRCAYLIEKNDYAAEFFKFCNLSVIDIDKDMPTA